LDGGDAAETVRFGLDGRSYEIDLNSKNAKRLRDSLAGYVASCTAASKPPPPMTRPPPGHTTKKILKPLLDIKEHRMSAASGRYGSRASLRSRCLLPVRG